MVQRVEAASRAEAAENYDCKLVSRRLIWQRTSQKDESDYWRCIPSCRDIRMKDRGKPKDRGRCRAVVGVPLHDGIERSGGVDALACS